MNKKIEKLLEDYYKKDGYEKWKDDDELLEILRYFDTLHKEIIDKHRWWNEYRYTIEVENTYIGYVYAETTGDESAWEKGYEFDPDSICEMERIEKTITTYQKIKEVKI